MRKKKKSVILSNKHIMIKYEYHKAHRIFSVEFKIPFYVQINVLMH